MLEQPDQIQVLPNKLAAHNETKLSQASPGWLLTMVVTMRVSQFQGIMREESSKGAGARH